MTHDKGRSGRSLEQRWRRMAERAAQIFNWTGPRRWRLAAAGAFVAVFVFIVGFAVGPGYLLFPSQLQGDSGVSRGDSDRVDGAEMNLRELGFPLGVEGEERPTVLSQTAWTEERDEHPLHEVHPQRVPEGNRPVPLPL